MFIFHLYEWIIIFSFRLPCDGDYKNITILFHKVKKDGVRGLGNPSFVFSPTQRQGTEGEGRIKSTLITLSWLFLLMGM